jgi:glycosyltransferase involved in cell wall biosynthesis
VRIAIYTIALNEERFVRRWAESAADADLLIIADTGSTDATVEVAREAGVRVHEIGVRPWRFDDARNAALALVPVDIDVCVALDMDEVLVPGWRNHLEGMNPLTTRPRYRYVWSWEEDGRPGLTYGGDKIHRRHGYRWRHPVHETLTPVVDERQEWLGLEIHHHPDSSKSRAHYFPLLEVARRESPLDDRTAFYYARELFFHGRTDEAIAEFRRYLDLPGAVWPPERAAAMRYIGKMGHDTRRWLTMATVESPDRREPWVDLAFYHYETRDWEGCLYAARQALRILEPPLEYLCESEAWGSRPHDLASIALWNLGRHAEAVEECERALALSPSDPRLRANLSMMTLDSDAPAQ